MKRIPLGEPLWMDPAPESYVNAYRDWRKCIFALRLELDASIVDDVENRCDEIIKEAYNFGKLVGTHAALNRAKDAPQ